MRLYACGTGELPRWFARVKNEKSISELRFAGYKQELGRMRVAVCPVAVVCTAASQYEAPLEGMRSNRAGQHIHRRIKPLPTQWPSQP
jgi:hypothetical protein